MSTTEYEQTNPAVRLDLEPGQIVQELGYDDDVDHDLREGIEWLTGHDLVDEDYDDIADAVLLWFRAEDGDLADTLLDVVGLLPEDGAVWLLTPRPGRDGAGDPDAVEEAARNTGLSRTPAVDVGPDWEATRLAVAGK
ncbi:DUF3052 domain-containing protein [Embleya sp. NPDC055664]|uniref:DUF3052 domain-containing protein n=1 Tax=Embleya sp. NPDC059237 TaxID=3346784 RepID=UPI0036AB2FF7